MASLWQGLVMHSLHLDLGHHLEFAAWDLLVLVVALAT
jgi:hypothetical protein